jgi:hypothetical protein
MGRQGGRFVRVPKSACAEGRRSMLERFLDEGAWLYGTHRHICIGGILVVCGRQRRMGLPDYQ